MNETNVLQATTPEIVVKDGHPVTTSLAVARAFGKDHGKVLRSIRTLEVPEEFHKANFGSMFIEVDLGNGAIRKDPAFHITRDGFTVLAMGFTGKRAMEFKIRYIEAFNRMEREIADMRTGGKTPLDSLVGGSGIDPWGKNPRIPGLPMPPSVLAKFQSGFQALARGAGYRGKSGIAVGDCLLKAFCGVSVLELIGQTPPVELPSREEQIFQMEEKKVGPVDLLDPECKSEDPSLLSLSEAAMCLSTGRQRMIGLLRQKGIFRPDLPLPYQKHVESHFFVVRESIVLAPFKRTVATAFVTKKGLDWLRSIVGNPGKESGPPPTPLFSWKKESPCERP